MVVEKESIGEHIKEAPNGAEVLKNMQERRDTGKKSLGIHGSRQREALTAGLFVLRSR